VEESVSLSPAPSPAPGAAPEPQLYHAPGAASSGSGKFAILFGAVIALLGANVYLYTQVNSLKTDLNSKRQANMLAGQAKQDAIRRSEELAAQLANEQKKAQAQLSGQITEVKQATDTAQAKIGEVGTEVTNVKSDVATTKSELEKTIANLKRVQGDLSAQGSLIATNGQELAALKALGERNYIEFRIAKSKEPQKVGDIALLLKKTDAKKNRYTVELLVDDKRVEKKDKTINEPVQFMVSKARQPYEIVVNEVTKDHIAGYLSTPKVQNARN
jgi:chromosome segregation ATPase